MAGRSRPLPRLLKDGCVGDGFEVAWEETVPYYVRHLGRAGDRLLVSMVVSRTEGALIEVDPRDGRHGRLVEGLPRVDKLAAAEDGWCVSTYRPRSGLPTDLHFFRAELSLASSSSFEAAINDLACLPWGVAVGTGDGLVRGFTEEGQPMWEWELPGARENHYYAARHVTAANELAVVSVMDTLYALDSDGSLQWSWRTPLTRTEDEYEVSPADVRDGNTGPGLFTELIETLRETRRLLKAELAELDESIELAEEESELAGASGLEESGLRELAGVGDPYMRWINRGGALDGGTSLANRIQSVVAGDGGVAVGDSNSQAFFIDTTEGRTVGAVCLEEPSNQVVLVADSRGRVRGAITSSFDASTITVLDGVEILGQTVIDVCHYAGVAIGHGLLTYTGPDLRGFDPTGRERWSANPGILWATAFDDVCVFKREQLRLVGIRCLL